MDREMRKDNTSEESRRFREQVKGFMRERELD